MPDEVDVAIVGAGPTALALACALAAQGVDVAVLDRGCEAGATSRAAVVHARILRVLEPLGISEDLVDAGVVVPRFTIRDRGRATSVSTTRA
jgi:2-polyprenyl-6-methoxyphenol hydroxylase-like FAD-dependent oxidoreductase